MREIKYRQPLFINGIFYRFHYWGFINEGFTGPDASWSKEQNSQQYAGLTDRTGKEIYEGDILITFIGEPHAIKSIFSYECYILHKRIWDKEPIVDYKGNILDIEIIGNIYENTKLLKSKGIVK